MYIVVGRVIIYLFCIRKTRRHVRVYRLVRSTWTGREEKENYIIIYNTYIQGVSSYNKQILGILTMSTYGTCFVFGRNRTFMDTFDLHSL